MSILILTNSKIGSYANFCHARILGVHGFFSSYISLLCRFNFPQQLDLMPRDRGGTHGSSQKLRTSFSSTTIMKLAQEHVFFETGCSFPNGNAKPPTWKKGWCRSLAQREFQGLPRIPFGWRFFSSKGVFFQMDLQIKNCRWPVCLTSQNMRRLENTLKVSDYDQHSSNISSIFSSRY